MMMSILLGYLLVALHLVHAAPPTPPYAPVSANPQEWDPAHPPPIALIPEYAEDAKVLLTPNEKDKTAELSPQEVNAWQWPAYLAAAVNCDPEKIKNWQCGINCERAGRVRILYAGGNNKEIPYWYVGVSGPTAVAVFKGTNTESLRSLLNDIKINKEDADEVEVDGPNGKKREAFPDSKGAEVHHGFMDIFQKIQPQLDESMREALAQNATRILVIGHSMGAAVAEIAAVYLQHEFPNVPVSARTFGLPRVGDGDWADYADRTLGNRSLYMVNGDDMVPHLPPKLLRYRHSGGEVWQKDDGTGWVWCEGQQNDKCSDGESGHFSSKHDGPYAGVVMTCDPTQASAPNITTYNWTDTGLANGGQS